MPSSSLGEPIARLTPEALEGFGEFFVLSDQAFADESNGEAIAFADETAAERPEAPLMGLHGKLYVADAGWKARVISGSANATRPAWDGNVEVVVEMTGPKGQVGIERFLADGTKGSSAFRDLLEPFLATEPPEPLTPREELLRSLEIAQRDCASGGGTTTISAEGADFNLLVELHGPVPTAVTPVVWPISLARIRARPLVEGSAEFKNLSVHGNHRVHRRRADHGEGWAQGKCSLRCSNAAQRCTRRPVGEVAHRGAQVGGRRSAIPPPAACSRRVGARTRPAADHAEQREWPGMGDRRGGAA